MRRQLDVAVVEAHDHAERDHVVAHRVDERAAELAVLGAPAQRPAHRVDHPPQRPVDLPDLLDAERPDLRVLALEAEVVDRGAGQMALRALAEDGDAADEVGAGLEVRQRPAVAAAAPVAGAHPADAAVGDEQPRRRGLRQDHRAALLGLLGEPAPELRQRGHVVAVVLHRRRRRDPHRVRAGQEVDALVLDRPVERHVRDPRAVAEEPPQPARVHDRAGEQVGAGRAALLEHRDRHLAEPLGDVRVLLEQLPEADRAGEPGRPGADDQHADLDPLVRRVGRRRDHLGRRERRREVGRPRHEPLRCRTSSASFGTISCRSPTTPRSEYSKMAAFGSLLIATIVPEPCIPTLCWIAPEMPAAT